MNMKIKNFLIYVFILFTGVHHSMAKLCPAPEDIHPCTCFGKSNNLHVHCAGVQSLTNLKTTTRSLREHEVLTFTIDKSVFEYLPYNIFENITIRHISISNSNFSRLANLGDPQFQGLEHSLESLKFEKTFTESRPLAYLFLEHLKKLHTFESQKNFIGLVHNLWFKDGPVSLREIKFVKADILNVQYKAFESLKNLRLLDLSDNEINFIPRSILPNPALQLEEINLERNKLMSLSQDFFEGMPQLKKVNLELNELSTLDETVWGQVWNNLQLLNIDYNPLVCDKKIRWMFIDGKNLEGKLEGNCFKPFNLIERELHTLSIKELK